jgi:8-oxo-dGTP pyrophosphatase MutT (NUDIX family)
VRGSGRVPALPAATLVMLRDVPGGGPRAPTPTVPLPSDSGAAGVTAAPTELQVLLVRRHARATFVPGAYVFPGGVLDPADASEATLARLTGLTPQRAAARLGTSGAGAPPAIAYYVAALRETFEETGLLLAVGSGGPGPAPVIGSAAVRRARSDLLAERVSFVETLERLGCRLDLSGLEYFAHWITPEAEPRRYDTRFFLGVAPPGAEPVPDSREMTDALWITPAEAVRRAREGALPMIAPTLCALDDLTVFATSADAIDSLGRRRVRTIMPGPSAKRNALPARPQGPD